MKPTRAFQKHLALLAGPLLLTACALPATPPAPTLSLQAQQAAAAQDWSLPLTSTVASSGTDAFVGSSADASALPGSPWWDAFGDTTLSRLMQSAATQNLDLRMALTRVQEARALQTAAGAPGRPALSAGASVAETRLSENGQLPVGRIPGLERDLTLLDTGFDASWEPDLFGRVQLAQEAASARTAAREDDAAALRLSVLAEVARQYFALRSTQQELLARQQQVHALDGLLQVAQRRQQGGDSAALDVERAQLQRDAAAVAVPSLQARSRNAALALGLLLGDAPEAGLALLDGHNAGSGTGATQGGQSAAPENSPTLLPAPFPTGVRADVLRQRPDVRSAEQRLLAASADLGTARAEWFPRLVIGGNAGFQAQNAGDLLSAGSFNAALVPAISWRILDGGRVQAQIDASDARREQAALAYEQTVLGALNDAERALSQYRYALDALAAQDQVRAGTAQTLRLLERRLQLGDVGRAEVLDALRADAEAAEALARQRGQALSDMVALRKALGGW